MSTNERSAAAPGGPEVGVTAPGVQGSGPRHGHVHPADGETTALADDARHDPGDRAGAHDHAAQDHAAQDHAGHDHADADDHAGHDHGAHAGHDHTGHDHADADDHAGHGHGGHDHRGHAGHDHGGTGDHAGHDDADHGDHAGHDHADADDHAGHDHDHGGHDHAGHAHGDGGHGHDHPGGVKGLILSLVRPHSHDAADSFDATLEASAEGMRTLKISLAGLAVTAVVQLVIFTVSGSVALLADLIHNFADALTAVPLAAAFVLSRRPATRQYTYGYGRSEDLAGVFIVATITASSALAAWEAIHRLIHPAHVHQVGWVIVAGLVGFVGNEAVAHYRITVGRRIGSAALEADGYHARTDGFTSLAVVVGAIGVAAGWQLADPIIGLVITVAILAVVRNAARDIYRRLMDAVDPALVARVTSILEGVEGIDGVDAVRIRWVGHELWAEAEVTADGDRSLADVHELTEAAHHDLLHRVPRLSQATIHAGPTVAAGADPHELTSHHRPPHR